MEMSYEMQEEATGNNTLMISLSRQRAEIILCLDKILSSIMGQFFLFLQIVL
jgi:hypothetical protein